MDDAELGPYSRNAQIAREYFGEVCGGIRVKLDDLFKEIFVDEGLTPDYTYFADENGEITSEAFPIHMMTTPTRGFETVMIDETPTTDETTSPVFLLTRVTWSPSEDLTPSIDGRTTIEHTTPIYMPPVVPKGHVFDFEDAASWFPLLASDGFTRG